MFHRVVAQKLTDVSEALTASIIRAMIAVIALMMAVAGTSETSVIYQTTWRNNPADSHLL
jgi:hypothetical protein